MTAAYLYYDPRSRPLTDAGVIMPGAKLQFYRTLTTTPEDVYADAALTTPLANPVEADTAGRFVPIYLDPSVTYRVQLYNSLDVLQFDTDPFAPARVEPIGTVVMFFGTSVARDAAYPTTLWNVCDGTNGSPDLRDRVPMGCSGSLSPGDTGGGSGITNTSSNGAHDHGGTVSAESLTEAQLATHGHDVRGAGGPGVVVSRPNISDAGTYALGGAAYSSGTPSPGYVTAAPADAALYIRETGDGDPHEHDITSGGAHTHTVDTTPPFLALWFLYKKAL